MAFDIVTAKKGYNHVTADQASDMQAGIFGKGRYALDTANGLACSMTDSNTLTVDTGSLIADGRHIVNDRAATFAIANGTQSAYRHDLAVLNVTIDSSTGVTTIEQDVLQGTPATTESAAEDPEYTAGNLLDGDLEATIPVARVSLAGLTPTCEPMLSSVSNLAALGDSVSLDELTISTHIWAWRVGRLVVLSVHDLSLTFSDYYAESKIATMPEGWRPRADTFGAMGTNDTPINVYLHVRESGSVYVRTSSGGSLLENKPVRGQVVYAIA